jgi:hypothetical protein
MPEENFPAAHCWHAEGALAPVMVEKEPPRQLWQTVPMVACGVTLYLPGTHAMQPLSLLTVLDWVV